MTKDGFMVVVVVAVGLPGLILIGKALHFVECIISPYGFGC